MITIPATQTITSLADDEQLEDQVRKGVQEGKLCTTVREPVPTFIKARCEKVITQFKEGQGPNNNCFIVLGRDRPHNIVSGAGGLGMTSCGMIDLVVGRYALNSANEMKKTPPGKAIGPEEKVNPNFITDAARVYITQKCLNIDQYFGFKNTKTSKGILEKTSAVAAKADHIRLIGRETVRIYCGGAQNVIGLGKDGETNTLGVELSKPKIELVAGNENNLEPAVLGNKLVKYLKRVEKQVDELQSDIMTIALHLTALNATMAIVTQGASPFSTNLREDIEMWVEKLFGKINIKLRDIASLKGFEILPGAGEIVSKSVFVS